MPGILGDGGFDQLGERHAMLDRAVVDESEPGHHAQLHAMRQLRTQEAAGALQPLQASRVLGFAAEGGEVDLGELHVTVHVHFGDGEHADARILHFLTDQLRQFALDLVGDAAGAGKVFWHLSGARIQGSGFREKARVLRSGARQCRAPTLIPESWSLVFLTKYAPPRPPRTPPGCRLPECRCSSSATGRIRSWLSLPSRRP